MKCLWRSRVSPVLPFNETKTTVFGQEFQWLNLSPGLKHSRISEFSWNLWSTGQGSSKATVRKTAQLGHFLKKTPRHRLLHDRNSTRAPFLGQRLPKPALLPAWEPATSAERRDGASADGDFCFGVLLRHLVLDLVCVPRVAAGHGAEGGRAPAAFDHATAGLHLHVQAPLHAAHLHVLVQVPVHVALGCGQLHLETKETCLSEDTSKVSHTLLFVQTLIVVD